MKKQFKSVRVSKISTCLTYALDRVGFIGKTKLAKDIPKESLVPFELSLIVEGSILVWQSKKSWYLWNTQIHTNNATGRPVLEPTLEFAGLHFGVIEFIEKIDNTVIITISDCIRNGNNQSFPTIALYTISVDLDSDEGVKLPTYILDMSYIN